MKLFLKYSVLSLSFMLSLGVKAISSDTLGNRKYIGLSADCEIKKQLPPQTRTGEVSIWRPLNEIFTTFSAGKNEWADTIKATNIYDTAGNLIERYEFEDNGYSITHYAYEYNEHNMQTCRIIENDEGATGYYTKSSKRVRLYDSICTDFAIVNEEYEWDDVDCDWKLYNGWKKEITRNEEGNIVGILISAYFSFFNDYEGGYVPITRITIEYGANGKALNYIYDVNWGYDEATGVVTWRSSSYKNIMWENTNGQLVEDMNAMIIGKNRMKSAQMYEQNSKLENKFVGFFTVNYDKEGPDFVKTTLYADGKDKEVHTYTTLDANGSYCEKFTNYSDTEMNNDGKLDEQDLFSITWQEVTFDGRGNMTLYEEFITEGESVREQLAGSRLTYKYDPVCGEIAEEMQESWTPVYVDYVLVSGDYKKGSMLTYCNYVDVTKNTRVTPSESYVPVQVYSLQGLYVGDTLENLPHGIYVVRQGGNVYKVMQK